MNFDQVAIAVFGAVAAWLAQEHRPGRRALGCIAGLCGQPFWLLATWKAGQWGMFAISVVYTLAWVRGLWLHWIWPRRAAIG